MKVTSSGTRQRYKAAVSAPVESKPVPVQPRKALFGHNKRNFWLDYPDEPFTREHNSQGLAEMTEFRIKFPQHRELHFKQNEQFLKEKFGEVFIEFVLDLEHGECVVRTTTRTFDPFVIVKAKLTITCISRGIPAKRGVEVLKDKIFCDVIHIKQLCKTPKIFKKRRRRLFGPNGSTLKAIEILTNTMIVIMGGTVTVQGSVEGCREVRKIAEDCMFNKHPIYRIKELMVINKLKKDPKMANKDWSEYLPKFTERKVKKKKKKKKKVLMPSKKLKRRKSFQIPAPQKRKEDVELETGEYFIREKERQKRRRERKMRERGEGKGENRKLTKDVARRRVENVREEMVPSSSSSSGKMDVFERLKKLKRKRVSTKEVKNDDHKKYLDYQPKKRRKMKK